MMISWKLFILLRKNKLRLHTFSIFLLLSMLILCQGTSVSASTSSNRLMGNDRYLTAIATSQKGWPNGADTAILTTGENFPDALSAAPLAQKYNAPILLTEYDNLTNDTLTELKRLKVKKVYILGGTGVISENIDNQLSSMGITPVRMAGQDRYETAMLVAKEVGVKQGIFVVSGLNFPDALSAAPIAAAKGMPIILVPANDLTAMQKDFFSKNKIPNTYIINGNNEISENIIQQLPGCEVISGSNAYERNVNLINRFVDDLDLSNIYIATGRNFPDALAASALAQKGNNPIVLLDGDSIPSPLNTFLTNNAVSKMNILGGYSVIAYQTEKNLQALPAQIASIADISATIQDRQNYILPKTVDAVLTNGLTSKVWVTWTLSSVDTSQTGLYYYKGTVNGYNNQVNLTLTVTSASTNTIKVENPSAEIVLGSSYDFPTTVEVRTNNNYPQNLPVSWNGKITMPNKAGTYTFKGSIDGISQTATLTLKVSTDAKVTIKDPNLENVIRNRCGNYDLANPLYKSDVLKIEYLDANSRNISDLSGIDSLTNLKFLNLGSNTSLTNSKLGSLTRLTNLKTLLLNNINNITDVGVLRSMSKLEVLDLRYDAVKDFTPLKTLTNLNQLYLKYNTSKDYRPLAPIYDNLITKDFTLDDSDN